jgi:aminoglycoside/choline kinase family phosphotransferase
MQTRAGRVLRPSDFAARNALDRDRFLFELEHFHTHYVLGLRALRPDAADEALLRAFYADLAERAGALPRAYCHRDFQARNLMVRKDGRLGLIDFQDARMGPYTYDAAALLRDSSLDIDPGLAEEMIDYLASRLETGPEEFRVDFDLTGLQRNLKDLGTFAYLATVGGRPGYLEYVPRTLRSVRRALARSRLYHTFFPVLDRHVLAERRPARVSG